jgi:lysophospholipase L1-like esterase
MPEFKIQPAKLMVKRGGLPNVMAKLQAGEAVTVAYLGGSITQMDGWRNLTTQWLRETYPQAKIKEIHAAIGGTGSDLGVFRLQQDVLRHKPDLLFVEFAVNDGGATPEQIWRWMEGILRQTWRANPSTDVCYVYTHCGSYTLHLRGKLNPPAASADELLAAYYGVPSINVALRTVQLGEAGKLWYVPPKGPDGKPLPVPRGVILWSEDDVHPLPAGHEVYAGLIARALKAWASGAKPRPHELPAPFVADNWERAGLYRLQPGMLSPGWKKLSAKEGLGKDFHHRLPEMWTASRPGEKISFKFRGVAATLYDLMGPNGGQAIVTLDGKRQKPVPRFDLHCTYYRLAVLGLGAELPDTVHTVTIEIDAKQPDRRPVTRRVKHEPDFDPKKYEGTVLWAGALAIVGEIVK